jgi:hypothetical protein
LAHIPKEKRETALGTAGTIISKIMKKYEKIDAQLL